MIIEVLRWYSVTASVLVILVGTAQWRRWPQFRAQERLHWLSTALLNLAALVGSLEALAYGLPGGVRIYLVAVAVTWLLVAVLHHPAAAWRARHRQER